MGVLKNNKLMGDKKMKHFKLFAVLTLIFLSTAYSQQDRTSSSYRSNNQPSEMEKGRETYHESDRFYPAELDDQLKQAQINGNKSEEKRIMDEMNRLTPEQYKSSINRNTNDDQFIDEIQPPFNNPDWYSTDVTVYNGAIKFGSPYFRQIDMKQGKDGNIYVAVNRAPASGLNGRIDVYRSSNGGVTWINTGGVQSGTAYFGTVSLLVERNGSSSDSVRVAVFYSRSLSENNDDATMNYASWRRDGSAFYSGSIGAPPAGMEYSFTSAVSDGAFYDGATWLGVMCTESNNAGTTVNNFKYYRSVNWGITWTGVTISTSYDDFYPSAEFRPNTGPSSDSVWIAVERRLSATQYEVRVIRTHWTPTASSNTYFVTSGGAGVKYEKPSLTIKQNRPADSVMYTVTKNGVSNYGFTVNGGGSWENDYNLGGSTNGNNKFVTWCASGTTGVDPFMGIWVSNDGDSINVRVGGRLGDLGATLYKRNSNSASTSVAPTAIVYTTSGQNRAAFSYAGFGPTNIYANQEALVTGVQTIGNEIPSGFALEQNYPNPFNPVTNINFSIPKAGMVKLVVFDALGRQVTELINANYNAGTYKVDFDASNLSTGVYFYKLQTDGFTDIKKMMLVK